MDHLHSNEVVMRSCQTSFFAFASRRVYVLLRFWIGDRHISGSAPPFGSPCRSPYTDTDQISRNAFS